MSRGVTATTRASPPWQALPAAPPAEDCTGEASAAALALAPVQRKKGRSLTVNESATMPKARMNLELDMVAAEDLDVRELQRAVTTTYGGSASVQVDRICDKIAVVGTSVRTQTVTCRVMFDDADEARSWRESNRVVQDNVAQNMGLAQGTVVLDAPATVEDVDSITLKLDSDSAHILCGACLLYNSSGGCEKVVHFSDRRFGEDAVRHSGDTKVDGKSVHTISIVQSKVPASVRQMYFTLCSCGPANLSGFKNPSIMLYDQAQPDANLLEYHIDKAADSMSCVIARLVRKPSWNSNARVMLACTLRRKYLSFLCVDIILAMAAETSWSVQALGTEEWNLQDKICNNYQSAKRLIEAKLKE
jgi:stress response protein SCP2